MKSLKQLKQLSAVAGLNLRLQLRDPAPTLVLTVIPLVLIPFMMPAFKAMLLTDGYRGVSGAEQAVPSIAVLFSFLAVQNIIDSFFNERSWGTWQRLEASPLSRPTVLTGKALVAYIIQSAQILVVLSLGAILFGFDPKGSLLALVATLLSFSAVLAALGVAIALWTHSRDTALSLSNIVGMLAAGIGGAFCTVSSFPDWAQDAARVSPAYWAIDAIHKVSLDGQGFADIWPSLAVLWGFFAAIAALALVQFRYRQE